MEPWGAYAGKSMSARLGRLLTTLGMGRGGCRKTIKRLWLKDAPAGLVDARVRGIKYRFDLVRNNTDTKILTSSVWYDKEELRFLLGGVNRGCGAFVDVGANTGYYSLTMAAHGCRKIVAIEPNPPTLTRLRENLSFNQWGERIAIAACCVGDTGEMPFYCAEGLGDASLIRKEGVAPIMVPARPLLDILREHQIDDIGAMKVDVEGFEDQALLPFFTEAPRTMFPRRIVLEHCHSDAWRIDVVTSLREVGYDVARRNRSNTFLARTQCESFG